MQINVFRTKQVLRCTCFYCKLSNVHYFIVCCCCCCFILRLWSQKHRDFTWQFQSRPCPTPSPVIAPHRPTGLCIIYCRIPKYWVKFPLCQRLYATVNCRPHISTMDQYWRASNYARRRDGDKCCWTSIDTWLRDLVTMTRPSFALTSCLFRENSAMVCGLRTCHSRTHIRSHTPFSGAQSK